MLTSDVGKRMFGDKMFVSISDFSPGVLLNCLVQTCLDNRYRFGYHGHHR
jgi:hypothetical protein